MSLSRVRRPGRRGLRGAGGVLVAIVILAAAFSVGRGIPGELLDRFNERGAPATLTDLSDVSQLQSAFNQADGTPRLILLFSPT